LENKEPNAGNDIMIYVPDNWHIRSRHQKKSGESIIRTCDWRYFAQMSPNLYRQRQPAPMKKKNAPGVTKLLLEQNLLAERAKLATFCETKENVKQVS